MADRKLKTWAEVKARRPLSVEAQAANASRVEQQIVEMNLQALRQQLGVTQAGLAEAAGMGQGEISRIEQREDHMVLCNPLVETWRSTHGSPMAATSA
jgi:DNA-binding XRE family transcriptional regulator